MRVLCVCDEGCNRSVHIAHLLKFRGHDTIPVGVKTADRETLEMLAGWADLVILTDPLQAELLPPTQASVWVWRIADAYKRPFNPQQHRLVLRFIEEHRERLISMSQPGMASRETQITIGEWPPQQGRSTA